MHTLITMLLCLLGEGYGQKAGLSREHIRNSRHSQGRPQRAVPADRFDPLKAFAMLFIALNPGKAFIPSGLCMGNTALCSGHLAGLDAKSRLSLHTPEIVMLELQKDDVDLDSLTVLDLKAELKVRKLKVSGKKAELIARLKEHVAEEKVLEGTGEEALVDTDEYRTSDEVVPESAPSEEDGKQESASPKAPEDLKSKLRLNLKKFKTKEALLASLDEQKNEPVEKDASVEVDENWDKEGVVEKEEEAEDRSHTREFNSYEEVVDAALKEQASKILGTCARDLSPHEEKVKVTGFSKHVIIDVLRRHPNAEEKIGSGIDQIFVAYTSHGSPSFHVQRTDGTVAEFSYRKCLDPVHEAQDNEE